VLHRFVDGLRDRQRLGRRRDGGRDRAQGHEPKHSNSHEHTPVTAAGTRERRGNTAFRLRAYRRVDAS
jgi:hypothetical protein